MISSASNVTVSRNNISDCSRWGIAVRSNHAAGSWNNTILGNHLENTVTLLFIPLKYWLFTPESQWQSRGKWCILQGYNGKRWA